MREAFDLAEWDVPWGIDDMDVVNAEFPTIEQCLAAGGMGVDIPNELYHQLPGISGSNYSLLAESNRHLDNKSLFSLGDTPALAFGTLFHTMALEPDTVSDRYVVMPNFDARTTLGKASRDKFMADNAGKKVVDKESFETAKAMARNARAICGDILEQGIKERSLFVDYDGLILKSRLDIDMEDEGDEYDLKSITLGTKDFSDATLEAHIKKLKYHWSAAHRNIVRRELGKIVRDNYLIFVNTGPGHFVRVIKLAKSWIKDAEAEVTDMLDGRRFYLASRIDVDVAEIDGRYRNYNN